MYRYEPPDPTLMPEQETTSAEWARNKRDIYIVLSHEGFVGNNDLPGAVKQLLDADANNRVLLTSKHEHSLTQSLFSYTTVVSRFSGSGIGREYESRLPYIKDLILVGNGHLCKDTPHSCSDDHFQEVISAWDNELERRAKLEIEYLIEVQTLLGQLNNVEENLSLTTCNHCLKNFCVWCNFLMDCEAALGSKEIHTHLSCAAVSRSGPKCTSLSRSSDNYFSRADVLKRRDKLARKIRNEGMK